MKKKKEITIEDLAGMVQRGLIRMDKRFDQMDKRFDKLEREIKEIKLDIEDLNLRMGEVAFRFEIKEIEKRVRKLELLYAK